MCIRDSVLTIDEQTSALRSDKTIIVTRPGEHSNLSMTVTHVEYMGRTVNVTVRDEHQIDLVASVSDDQYMSHRWVPGDSVGIRWNPEDLHPVQLSSSQQ